jgi:hypothetical protein
MKSTTYSKAVSPSLTSSARSLIPTVLLPDCFNASGTHLPAESCSKTLLPSLSERLFARAKLAHHKHKHKRATSCRICLAFPSSLSVTDIRTLHQSR